LLLQLCCLFFIHLLLLFVHLSQLLLRGCLGLLHFLPSFSNLFQMLLSLLLGLLNLCCLLCRKLLSL